MRRGFRDMNPTLRGFLIIAAIAVVIVVLQLQTTLAALFLLARIMRRVNPDRHADEVLAALSG